MSETGAARAEFAPLQGSPGASGASEGELNLDAILDVRLTLTLEVGRSRITVRDLLALAPGSVVELDRKAGEPLDMFVNGVLVARGEVVVVNERFGLRLTEVVSAGERVRHLG
ncbi:MAG: flagellar motor switch protein FliN [Steroidobacteraceae bacterium]